MEARRSFENVHVYGNGGEVGTASSITKITFINRVVNFLFRKLINEFEEGHRVLVATGIYLLIPFVESCIFTREKLRSYTMKATLKKQKE